MARTCARIVGDAAERSGRNPFCFVQTGAHCRATVMFPFNQTDLACLTLHRRKKEKQCLHLNAGLHPVSICILPCPFTAWKRHQSRNELAQ